jgi:zinc transporter, ZIP family
MADQFHILLLAIPLAVGAGAAGGVVAVFLRPPQAWRGYAEHFAAGLFTAIIAVDLVPEALAHGEPVPLLIGFAVGGSLMVAVKVLSERLEDAHRGNVPTGMVLVAGLDTLVDGIIIGVGLSVSPELGLLLFIALGIELFSLTLSVASEYHKAGTSHTVSIAVTSGIAAMLAVGVAAGLLVLGGLALPTQAIVLSFAAAALLYLVTEELLVKGHEDTSSPRSVSAFYLGFLALMAFTLLGPG